MSVVALYIFVFFVVLHTVNYKYELDEKLIDWKSLSTFWKIP